MTRFVKDGAQPIESSAPRDRVNLLAQGYRVEELNPSQHNVEEVVAHLEAADPAERARVLAAERSGKARRTVLDAPTEPAGGTPTE
ncbi:hypothetical protein [Georgenia wangjunii]|uniref:hypothetical protein n=1 Tax=Georgenia wangjunii TaxID=3117730 RepID=UPI002F26CC90